MRRSELLDVLRPLPRLHPAVRRGDRGLALGGQPRPRPADGDPGVSRAFHPGRLARGRPLAGAFGEDRVYADPSLIGASVRAVFGIREFERARTVIRKLDREGRLRAAIEQDPSLLATAAWAMQARPQEALGLLDKYDGDARADVVRYMIDVTIATRPITPPDSQDLADVERQLSWGLFLQGRLGELARMSPADEQFAGAQPQRGADRSLPGTQRGGAEALATGPAGDSRATALPLHRGDDRPLARGSR